MFLNFKNYIVSHFLTSLFQYMHPFASTQAYSSISFFIFTCIRMHKKLKQGVSNFKYGQHHSTDGINVKVTWVPASISPCFLPVDWLSLSLSYYLHVGLDVLSDSKPELILHSLYCFVREFVRATRKTLVSSFRDLISFFQRSLLNLFLDRFLRLLGTEVEPALFLSMFVVFGGWVCILLLCW